MIDDAMIDCVIVVSTPGQSITILSTTIGMPIVPSFRPKHPIRDPNF
jgi:citrate lyase alpha subunit